MDSHRLSTWVSKNSSPRFQDLEQIKRPFKASNQLKHHKTLKQSVKPNRIKPLPHGVYRNSLNLVPTQSPRCVKPLCFLSRRIPTVGSLVILERSSPLSKKSPNVQPLHLPAPPPHFWFSHKREKMVTVGYFVPLSFILLFNVIYVPKLWIFNIWNYLGCPFPSFLYSCNMCHMSTCYM